MEGWLYVNQVLPRRAAEESQIRFCSISPIASTRPWWCPRYFIRTPYNGVLANQTRHDYCPQSSMIRGVMSPGLVGRW
ncbi:hypothetical protein DRE43_28235 [Salmonella enterica subsp. enterica serovar Java]|uniref:Uncharacterized protein n=1 Tax=Salmonella enterica TaxID=28901 RepID=A0A3R0XKQ4_SALER|nr:hypothetical protein [Salmonella enterica subsp. diarizonae]EAU1515897.1 hypothetical protein [Salmonella enterica]EBQ9442368.1 hypothetical protein [Salmonella enterica subsp. enterica serovar Cerro]EBX2068443.1 hypothetical protein [Salmonella enterica subsp. enterica serovar Java]EAU7574636.1 hypothetical protein [Salmonella enterica]